MEPRGRIADLRGRASAGVWVLRFSCCLLWFLLFCCCCCGYCRDGDVRHAKARGLEKEKDFGRLTQFVLGSRDASLLDFRVCRAVHKCFV